MAQTNNTSFLGSLSMPADDPNAQTMIEVDHVSMVFNIASEQLNSLKEYAIALSRRELRFKEFYALNDVSFKVKQGDVFGILGTNGSGKSTILKIIAGVLEPTRGTCKVGGSIAPLIELGAGFDLELTARENIFLNGALLGYSKKFIQQNFDEIVDFAEVRDFLDMPMKNYSSGMVARIAFAIATVIVPDVLIVDEVLSVGDFMFQQKCERRIQSLIKDHGVTVLIVSHNNAQIERLCNKAVWIEKGHLRAIGSAKEVCGIYRAVGGRSGSAESEAVVLEALSHCNASDAPRSISLAGENRYGTAAKIATQAKSNPSTVFVTNSDSGVENYVANSLAGLTDGMVLTTASDFIPDATAQELHHVHPSRIVVVGDEVNVDAHAEASLRTLCPNAAVTRIEDKGLLAGLDAYSYGSTQTGTAWSDTVAVVVQPCDASLVTLGGYLFNQAIPVFFLDAGRPDASELQNVLASAKRCLMLASEEQLPDSELTRFNDALRITRFTSDNAFETNRVCNEWLASKVPAVQQGKLCIITSPQSTIDNYGIGQLAGRLNSEVRFTDPLSLDSVASTLDELRANSYLDELLFIGNDLRFSAIDKLMFESALRRK